LEGGAVMGERRVAQEALFYEFNLEHFPSGLTRRVPALARV
jgi:hypothetical protein